MPVEENMTFFNQNCESGIYRDIKKSVNAVMTEKLGSKVLAKLIKYVEDNRNCLSVFAFCASISTAVLPVGLFCFTQGSQGCARSSKHIF